MNISSIKILIVEDEMVIAANISLELSKLGYEVTGIVSKGEDAINHVKNECPDIILMDINLKGKLDGIETVKHIQEYHNIPVIYLTANADDAHFNKAKITKPAAFISKPYKKLDLQRAIQLAALQIQPDQTIVNEPTKDDTYILSDSIFVKDHEKMIKIEIPNILYIEAERNYCRIYTQGKEYLIVMTLKALDQKLPNKHFLRVHRSFIVNVSQVEEIANTHLVIGKKAIPISKTMRTDLLNRLQTI